MTTLTAATPAMGGGLTMGARMRPGAPVGAASTLGGTDVLRIIRQRLVMIVLVWLLCIGATVAITLLMERYWPTYQAVAYIRVDSVDPINIMNPSVQTKMTEEEQDRAVINQAILVKNQEVLNAALQDASLINTQWYAEATAEVAKKRISLIDLLDDVITATPVRQSSFLTVGAKWRINTEVPIIVNTVVEKYSFKVQEMQKAETRNLSQQLNKEYSDAQSVYDQMNQELQELRTTSEVLGQGTEPNEQLQTLNAVVTELELDALGKKAIWEQLQNQRPDDMPVTAELQTLLNNDGLIVRMQLSVQEAEDNLRRARQRFGANHRVVKDAEASVKMASDQLAQETATKIMSYNTQQLSQAQRNYLESQDMLLKANEQRAKAMSDQRDKDAKFATYLRKLEDREMQRARVESLGGQKDIVSMNLRAPRLLRIDVIHAQEPKKMSSPRREIWIPAGCVLGLMFAVGLALLLDVMDKSIRTPRDVARHSAIPVLGTVPTSHDDEIEIPRVETASIDAPHSIIAEAFRQLRANLFFSAPAEQQGVLMVTSPSGGNGKTTVATNLAISIALSGRRVLLVDANFRRAALPKIFPQIRQEGLSNILIGQSRLAELVTATAVPGLDVLGSGPTPPNPAELLGSSYLRDLVVDARSRYDQVIFDGPPVLLVSDAMVLAGAVDGVLIVCQYRGTSRGALQRAKNQLDAINSRVFGAVLNMVETRAGGYFRKHYREFYEYHETEAGAAVEPARRLESAVPVAAEAAGPVAAHIIDDKIEPEPEEDAAHIHSDTEIARQIESAGDVHLDNRLALGDDLDQLEMESQSRPSTEHGSGQGGVADHEIPGLGDNVELDPDFGLDDTLGLGGMEDPGGGSDNLGWSEGESEPGEGPRH